MSEELTSTSHNKPVEKHIFHLHRRLFLLVFAIMVLWQSALFVDMRLQDYYQALRESFKVILTVPGKTDNEQLAQMGETLNQKEDILSVQLFSPEDGLETVRKQNPQLANSLLLMGKHKMPAYFELRLSEQAINNIRPFIDNVASEYDNITAHYNAQHAQLIFYTGVCAKLLRLSFLIAGILFLAFMFLVEAYPSVQPRSHSLGGAVCGILAAVGACILLAVLIYPTGLLNEHVAQITTWGRQVLLVVFSGLLGWTLSKWQKF